jgi:hypothetical protein
VLRQAFAKALNNPKDSESADLLFVLLQQASSTKSSADDLIERLEHMLYAGPPTGSEMARLRHLQEHFARLTQA